VLLQNSSRQHAVINAPVDSNSVWFARVLSDGSFPHVLAGSASTLDGFGTCSMFIRITACLLADPLSGLLHQGLRTFHCFHARLGCYRLERKLPGGFIALPLEFCAFSRRTKTRSKAFSHSGQVVQ
jgi:hypothetical protein